jgi:signal transduction histidine kinase
MNFRGTASTNQKWMPFNLPVRAAHLKGVASRRGYPHPAAVAVVLVLVMAVSAALTSALFTSVQGAWLLQRVFQVAAAALLVAAGALLMGDRAQRMTAVLLLLAGGCWFVVLISVSLDGPVPFVRALLNSLFWFLIAWTLLRYPERKVATRSERAFLVVTGIWLIVGPGLLTVFRTPSGDQPASSVWWPNLVADPDLYLRLLGVALIVNAVVVMAFLVLVVLRLRRIGGVDRWVLAPMTCALCAAGMTVLLRAVAPLTSGWQQTALLLESLGTLAVPAALLAAIVRRRLTRTAVADIVVDLARPEPNVSVTASLRTALRDPTLQVLFWVEQTQSYMDETGQPAADPADGRLVVPLDARAGPGNIDPCPPDHLTGGMDVVVADPALARHQGLVNAAVGASGLALRNARLQAELRAQLDQVTASRRRIAEAGVAERRKIERDLHDGLQQRLLALTLTLAQIRAGTDDPAVLQGVETMRTEMHAALQELRDVAHGVLPAMLAQGGLRPALDDVVERLPLTVHLDIAHGRWPASVETTAYFIACEALANVAKHATADHADVRITAPGSQLRVEVLDNGRGGADPRRGTGLAGLADRARAIGGELTVQDRPSGGTVLEAVLPCE